MKIQDYLYDHDLHELFYYLDIDFIILKLDYKYENIDYFLLVNLLSKFKIFSTIYSFTDNTSFFLL